MAMLSGGCTSAPQGFTPQCPALLRRCLLFAFLCVRVTGAHGSGLGGGPMFSAAARQGAVAAACAGGSLVAVVVGGHCPLPWRTPPKRCPIWLHARG